MENKSLTSLKFKVFLGGIALRTTPRQLLNQFQSQFSSLLRVEIPLRTKAKNERRNKGFAVLHLKSEQDFQALLSQDFINFQGRNLAVRKFLKGGNLKHNLESKQERRIFLAEIPSKLKIQKLEEALAQKFGPVEETYRLKNPNSSAAKSVGHCYFKNKQGASAALKTKKIFVEGFKIKIKPFKCNSAREDSGCSQNTPKTLHKNEEGLINNLNSPRYLNRATQHHVKPTSSRYRHFEQKSHWRMLNSIIGHLLKEQNYRLNLHERK